MKIAFKLSILVVLISCIALFIGQEKGVETGQLALTSCSRADLNTTVIVLNWSRLFNVKKIVSRICEDLFDDTVSSIIVWNNNPNPLTFEDFSNSSCLASRLQLINSPDNLYFQARYMACERATTPYCFIQDDDYLVRPEVIQALAARMDEKSLSAIHVQPPDEMLSSQLRTVLGRNIHATFAWLGYGTIVKRSRVVEFLRLLDTLQLSEEEHKMADNYFTILSNEIPERWFDAGIPLGGGQPFTVGTEGEERNNRHIIRAAELLDTLSHVEDSTKRHVPYLTFADHHSIPVASISYAPCHGRVCIFKTSIQLLPDDLQNSFSSSSSVTDILELEKRRRLLLGEDALHRYLEFPPSNAVDGVSETAFRSPENAKREDWILLDLTACAEYDVARLILLVHESTEGALRNSTFETSKDGLSWDAHEQQPLCTDSLEHMDLGLRICVFHATEVVARQFRVRLREDATESWFIYEIYLI